MITLTRDDVTLRPFAINDASDLSALINNKKIWDNVRDALPYPYSLQDAWDYITLCEAQDPVVSFAIDYKGKLAGGAGLVTQIDVHRMTSELGYWIGEPYWNKGIATQAVKLLVDYGFEQLNLVRIYSGVFGHNKASQRVLEKAGFTLEAIMKKAYVKNEIIGDEYRYAITN